MRQQVTKWVLLALIIASFSCCNNQTLTKKDTAGHKKEFIIASYNIRLNVPKDGVNAWPHRKDQVIALIRYHEFDIVGIQEGLMGQVEDLEGMEEFSYIGVGRDDGDTKGEHTAIFYKHDRFQLHDKGDFWLSETPEVPSYGWGANHRRICSWGKFTDLWTNQTFFVFNTHFDHRSLEARQQSGILIVNKIKEIAGGHTVFLLGDFNSNPESQQIQKIKTILNDTYEVTELPPYGPVGTFNGFNLMAPMDRRIDYIFVSENIRVLKYGVLTDSYDHKFPSDHLPVVIKCLIK